MTGTEDGFCEFDVSLIRGADEHIWLSAECDQGSIKAISVPAPVWPFDFGDDATPLAWLNEVILFSRPVRKEGGALGRVLCDLVFGTDVVRQLFERQRGVASSMGQQVLLRVLGAPEDLAHLPWELMDDPAAPGKPIVLSGDVHLARTPRIRSYPVRTLPIEPPLNLLVLISNPLPSTSGGQSGLTPFDPYEEKRHLLADLRPLIDDGLIHVEVEDRPTITAIRRRIMKQRRGFHAIHYLGHAAPDGLYLENMQGRHELVRSDRFCEMIQPNRDLRLVVFAGCETAKSPGSDKLGTDIEDQLSVTHQVVRQTAPAVIGMQAVLPFRTERFFTRSFYQALTTGYSVAQSLKFARSSVWDGHDGQADTLDWAIPTLYSGGSAPGAVIDPNAQATPIPAKRRVSLRLSPVNKELRFVARHFHLRETIDVLERRKPARLVCIRGQDVRADDISAFLDRAMEELGPDTAQLSFSASELNTRKPGFFGVPPKTDPQQEIAKFLKEILRQWGGNVTDLDAVDPDLQISVLLEHMSDIPLAIAIDHADLLEPDHPIVDTLRDLLNRRSQTRLAVVHPDRNNPFNRGMDAGQWQGILLRRMRYSEVWNWISRQLPDLARYTKDRLEPVYWEIFDWLDKWERLARDVANYSGRITDDTLLELLSHQTQKTTQVPRVAEPVLERATTPTFGSVHRAPQMRQNPVRVAVAGPYTDGLDDAFVRAISLFARTYDLPINVSDERGSGASIIAKSQDGGSPFDEHGRSDVARILRWFGEVLSTDIDIIVLDFGNMRKSEAIASFAKAALQQGRLVIAAGGNSRKPTYPAWAKGILAVGALDTNGATAEYSPHFPKDDKPDIYTVGSLENTELASWVAEGLREGTSASALYASAAAALVWSVYRNMPGAQVGQLLVDSATVSKAGYRVLNIPDALFAVRALLLKDTLERDDMSLSRLVAETGLPDDTVVQTLESLVASGEITTYLKEQEELYSFPNRIAARYDAVRAMGVSDERTRLQQDLMTAAQALARRTRLHGDAFDALWSSDEDGDRILALATVFENPDPPDWSLVREGLQHARSDFEQYYLLELAQRALPELAADQTADLRLIAEALHDALVDDKGDLLMKVARLLATLDAPKE